MTKSEIFKSAHEAAKREVARLNAKKTAYPKTHTYASVFAECLRGAYVVAREDERKAADFAAYQALQVQAASRGLVLGFNC